MELIRTIWRLLGVPLDRALDLLGVDVGPWGWVHDVARVAILFLCLVVVGSIVRAAVRSILRAFRSDPLTPLDDVHALQQHRAAVEAGQRLDEPVAPREGAVALLRKQRRYGELGETYLAAAQPREAAKWFLKAGDRKRAAQALAQAGRAARAARMMMRDGEYALAGAFYTAQGAHRAAGKAYRLAGDLASAAHALSMAHRFREAMEAYREYFNRTTDPLDRQLETAIRCIDLLEAPKVAAKAPADTLAALYLAIGKRYERANRPADAAKLYALAGVSPNSTKAP